MIHFFAAWKIEVFSGPGHEALRRIFKDIEGVVQIKDDLVIHGWGRQHDM